MCVCKKLWGWLRIWGLVLDFEGGLYVGDIVGLEFCDELWVLFDVMVDVVYIDRLILDGEFRWFIGSIVIVFEDYDGKDFVIFEFFVQVLFLDF